METLREAIPLLACVGAAILIVFAVFWVAGRAGGGDVWNAEFQKRHRGPKTAETYARSGEDAIDQGFQSK